MRLSERSKRIQKSETLRVKEKALQLKQQGVDVVDLTAGEPDFPTPRNICEAGIQAINDGFTRYTANAGIPELRQAIVEKLQRENNLSYDINQIIVSCGAKQVLANAVLAVAEEGDEAIIPAPYWVSYVQQIYLTGATPVIIDTSKTGFKVTADDLQAKITPRTRLFMFNSPSNPCGVVYTANELAALAEVLAKHDVWILSDEIYEKIIFDNIKHKSLAEFPGLYEKTIVINGVSKSYSMTGWRIGYSAAPLEVTRAMGKIQSHYTMSSSISQKAALEAISGDQSEIAAHCKDFERRRNLCVDIMKQKPQIEYVYPQGAFYLFIDVSTTFGKTWNGKVIESALDFCDYLIETQHLVVVPGNAFGAPTHLRMSFAASDEELKEGLSRLFRGIENL
ncbi:MAG: pyridoxal phosphate-dependent aminotransferase [Calditrichia bacterium]